MVHAAARLEKTRLGRGDGPAARQRLLGEGPLAYFRNQGSVASFMADLMETHFALTADPTLPTLRNIDTAADAYPRKRLLDYLSGKAPQL